jgi:SAM-dependent methyltransferase
MDKLSESSQGRPGPYGSFRERFCWVSSYERPSDVRLKALSDAMTRFYQHDAVAQKYFVQSESGNTDWLNGDYPFQEAVLRRVVAQQIVVEFSCGNGYGAKAFQTQGARYLGFDLSLASSGERSDRSGNALVAAANGYDAPIASGTADWAVSFFVIEHIVWPMRFLDEMMRVCKVGGCIALAFPDHLANVHRSIGSIRLGRSPGRIHDKIRIGRWLDAIQSVVELKVIYPLMVARWRKHVFSRRQYQFMINTQPECLVGPYRSDNDAVYFASEEEIALYLSANGYRVVARSGDVRDRHGNSLNAAAAGNGFIIATRLR